MSKAIILQHVAHEGPGRIIPVFQDYGIPTEVRHLYRGDEVPTDLDEIRVLIVLGGPMSVADAGGDAYPFLAPETELLKRHVELDRPVLGICLGAQLLAHAAGAKVYPNVKMGPPGGPGQPPKPVEPIVPMPEIGFGPINLPFPGGTEPILFGLMDGTPMLHWHFDTFDLPAFPRPANPAPPPAPPPPTGNALLASTRTCRNQAFRFKDRLFGFQFHIESDRVGIETMISGNRRQAIDVLGPDAEAKLRADTEAHYARYERAGNKILTNFVQFLHAYSGAR
ncbi:MAG TPA: gamma-glutamyl-gamma-aminobutyrate hydrolase family protein [Tepidisphaeraceae bacterium]|jgi:GMP synthase-like glutamine amidotransferase